MAALTIATLLTACASSGSGTRDSLPPALSGTRQFLQVNGHKVAYYANGCGTGRPLVLLHAVNAAASAYEMKPLWDEFAPSCDRPVYALEWLGFGSSDRPDQTYTPEEMTRGLRALLDTLDQPADVVALSLGSEFAARAAREGGVASLTLISPTGLGQKVRTAEQKQSLYNNLQPWKKPLFSLLSTKPVLKWFLQKSFVGAVPQEVLDYASATSHITGAMHAPIFFISGKLFTERAAEELYQPLDVPTLILFDRDGYVSFDQLPAVVQNPLITVQRIPNTLGMPHWEKRTEVVTALQDFWKELSR